MELKSPKVRILSGKYKGHVGDARGIYYESQEVWVRGITEFLPFSEVELVEEEDELTYAEIREAIDDLSKVSPYLKGSNPEQVEECQCVNGANHWEKGEFGEERCWSCHKLKPKPEQPSPKDDYCQCKGSFKYHISSDAATVCGVCQKYVDTRLKPSPNKKLQEIEKPQPIERLEPIIHLLEETLEQEVSPSTADEMVKVAVKLLKQYENYGQRLEKLEAERE